MSKKEAPLDALRRYVPPASAGMILNYLHHYKVHLTVTRNRSSVLGDYRHANRFKTHRISVNGTLNPYSFLITLVHELAHLVTFIHFGNRVDPHGREWKKIYAEMLHDFLKPEILPEELIALLRRTMHDLPASSCSDDNLMRALKKYDRADGTVMVEQIAEGACFEAGKDKIFRRGKRLRKRYQCLEIATGRLYLFSPIYEVKAVDSPLS